ncbi:MAG: glycosyltransferase, partial [Campylobacterales bacterium]|nr:glycosyltransferase [Campylobacterales bacterium]
MIKRFIQQYKWEKFIRKSGLFDTRYYLFTYPDVRLTDTDPLKHFIRHGAKEGRNPNGEFDTNFYLAHNVDVKASGINPFYHWLKYGKEEGRKSQKSYSPSQIIEANKSVTTNLASNFSQSQEAIVIDPKETLKENHPTVIFISHEASQTGAPVVLLSLMQWIKNNTRINFSIIIGKEGPLNAKFEALAPTFYMEREYQNREVALKKFCGQYVQIVYINTIASAHYAQELKFMHTKFITHVHEMESAFKVFEPHVNILKQICKDYIAVSQGSIDAMKRRFDMSQINITFLKPFIEKNPHAQSRVKKTTSKHIIYGCGSVEKRKGFDIFCQVAAHLQQKRNDFEMHWIGLDQNKDLVPAQVIDEEGVKEVVKFLGPQDYPRDYFMHGSIFLLPSREDPYPLVCLEAAECDLPVVCFDEKAGGMHSFVEDDAGIVVPYLKIEAMAEAIDRLLNNDALRQEMGQNAHQKVIERHYVDAIAPQILKLLPKTACVDGFNTFDMYKNMIDSVKVVSFDIFDTLITRKVASPDVVFDIVEYKHTQNQAAPIAFFNERMRTAGEVLNSHKGKVDDVCIDEIYKSMAFYKNSQIEKETELQVCTAHPFGKKLYDYALLQNKIIYIASDMYLDQSTIEKILVKNGYEKWNKIYLSSSIGKKKDTGKLFEVIKDEALHEGIKEEDILHIGDNWRGDIQAARENGFNAVRFVPLYEKNQLVSLPKDTQLSQIGKIWESFSIQASRLWRESNRELSSDVFIALGFELSGPLSAMMAMHTKQVADESGTQKIVFMARDGRIIKKAFDRLYAKEIEAKIYQTSYLSLSRSTVIPATFEHPLSPNDIYFLIEGLHLAQKP